METKDEYTFGYIQDEEGWLRIPVSTTSQCPHRPPRAMWLVNQKIKSAIPNIRMVSATSHKAKKGVRGFVLWGQADHWPGRVNSPISVLQISSISSTVIRGVSFPLKVPEAPTVSASFCRFGTLWYVHDAHEVRLSIAPVVGLEGTLPGTWRFSRPVPTC